MQNIASCVDLTKHSNAATSVRRKTKKSPAALFGNNSNVLLIATPLGRPVPFIRTSANCSWVTHTRR